MTRSALQRIDCAAMLSSSLVDTPWIPAETYMEIPSLGARQWRLGPLARSHFAVFAPGGYVPIDAPGVPGQIRDIARTD